MGTQEAGGGAATGGEYEAHVYAEMERRWLLDAEFHFRVEQAVEVVKARRAGEDMTPRHLMREAAALALVLAEQAGDGRDRTAPRRGGWPLPSPDEATTARTASRPEVRMGDGTDPPTVGRPT